MQGIVVGKVILTVLGSIGVGCFTLYLLYKIISPSQQQMERQTVSIQRSTQNNQTNVCPITENVIRDRAELNCGHAFEMRAIEVALRLSEKCPRCGANASLDQIRRSPLQ